MYKNIVEVLAKLQEENPKAKAISVIDREWSRAELWQMSGAIAVKLPQGTQRVGIIMDHSATMVASILAALRCGAAYVPVEPFFPKERIHFMLQDAMVDVVITQRKYQHLVRDIPLCLVEAEEVLKHTGAIAAKAIGENDLAYILYTSGTTGKPKGVAVTHGNVLHYAKAFRHEFSPTVQDVMLQYSVCSFDIFVEEVFAALLSGASIAIPAAADKENIHKLMDFVASKGVTIISGFPYLLQEMNALPVLPKSLRLLISGGDVLREVYVDRLVGQVMVYNTYGPSETTVCAAYYNCSVGKALSDGTYPVGKAVQGTEIILLDKDDQPVAQGQTGELCILGAGVSKGYIGDRQKENLAFGVTADGRRIYHSGDLGYFLPDGNIAFLHRKDSQIMIYGKRVEVSEVENVLLQSELIHQACVCPKTDEKKLSHMVAYIVKKDDSVTLPAIKEYLADYLTDFMIPEKFVELPRLPLNANGKVDKAALKELEEHLAA
ncbi:MAG: amino acid adenylation domain-containing protein [Selenomonas sp.]|nr:amino acid adenylation domain-containing protein [Selenomonas sp.]